MARNNERRQAAEDYIFQRLQENPNIPANTIARELDERGLSYRRTTMLSDIRGYAESLGVTGRKTHDEPEKFTRKGKAVEFIDNDGRRTINVVDRRTRSTISRYLTAVKNYVNNGNDRELKKFRGKSITVNGVKHRFVTDKVSVLRLARAGEFTFESMYELPEAA